jgi:hypothetical protein
VSLLDLGRSSVCSSLWSVTVTDTLPA